MRAARSSADAEYLGVTDRQVRWAVTKVTAHSLSYGPGTEGHGPLAFLRNQRYRDRNDVFAGAVLG